MPNSPKLLLTGASGFIGSRLALQAHSQGYELMPIGMANTPAERSRIAALREAGIEVRLGNLRDADFMAEVTHGVDVVIHLAAAQHETNVPDGYFMDVNVEGTRVLLDASVRAGVRRFVYGSTIGVYGAAHGGVLDEDSQLLPDNAYGRSKVHAEQLVRSYGERLETTIVRISETYGPGDYRLLKLFNAVARGVFLLIGKGENTRQPIHVDDLVHGILLAARHPAASGETFVLAGSEVLTTEQMMAEIRAVLGRQRGITRIPSWPFTALATLMERTLRPLGIRPPLNRRRLDFFVKSFQFDTEKARTVLGFEPKIRFSQGSLDTARWYAEQGMLKPAHLIVPQSRASSDLHLAR